MQKAGSRSLLLCAAALAWILPSLIVQAATADSSNSTDSLDARPVIEQLLERKAFLRQHLKSEAWKQHIQQQFDARSSPHNEQGVLIVAGGRDMFANAAITLTVLRNHLHSTITVEIVHFGQNELPPDDILNYIKSFNSTANSSSSNSRSRSSSSSSRSGGSILAPVYVTDALAAAPPEKVAAMHRKLPEGFKSFPAKVYALTHVTRFRKVLLLDADSMPLVDPNLLFQVPMFQRSGSLFWPDLWYNAWVNDTIYTLVGDMQQAPWVGNEHHRLVDSGQMLFDREQHADVLEYLWLLNSHHEWVYKHMHGDKDTFLLAFSMAGKRDQFFQVPCFARDAMRDMLGHKHRFHHLGMVQSIPPATLGAAMRAQARTTGGDSDSSSGSGGGAGGEARLLLQQRSLPGSSSSSRWQRWLHGVSNRWLSSVLPAAVPDKAAAVTPGRDLFSSTNGGSSSSSSRRLLQARRHIEEGADMAMREGLLSSSSSSAGSGGSSSSSSRRLLQAGGQVEEGADVAMRQGLLPDGPALPPSQSEQQQQQQQQGSDGLDQEDKQQQHQQQQQKAQSEGSKGASNALVGLPAALQPQPEAVAAAAAAAAAAAEKAKVTDGLNMDTGMEDPMPHWAESSMSVGELSDSYLNITTGDHTAYDLQDERSQARSAAASAADDANAAAGAVVMGPKGPPKRAKMKLRHVGVPVFFHRTSFNSKFFPDCLNADKIKTGYCEVEWVSVPLSNEQAGHSLKPHMFAWDEKQIDTSYYTQHCGRNATHRSGAASHNRRGSRHLSAWDNRSRSTVLHATSLPNNLAAGTAAAEVDEHVPSRQLQEDAAATAAGGHRLRHRGRRRPVIEQYGLPPEHRCEKLPIGENVMPIPVMRVELFPYMQKVLNASYEAFGVVREKAGVKV